MRANNPPKTSTINQEDQEHHPEKLPLIKLGQASPGVTKLLHTQKPHSMTQRPTNTPKQAQSVHRGRHPAQKGSLRALLQQEGLLKEKVLVYAKRFYTKESAEKFTQDFIAEKQRISLSSKDNKVTFRTLFGPKYRKQFSLGCVLNFLQQMTGINFMLFFSTQLFDEGDQRERGLYDYRAGSWDAGGSVNLRLRHQ